MEQFAYNQKKSRKYPENNKKIRSRKNRIKKGLSVCFIHLALQSTKQRKRFLYLLFYHYFCKKTMAAGDTPTRLAYF